MIKKHDGLNILLVDQMCRTASVSCAASTVDPRAGTAW